MTVTVVTTPKFAGLRWQPPRSYEFAADQYVVELGAAELPAAACSLPVGFLDEADGTLMPVALLGVEPTRNLFVARDGTWLAAYVPAVLRASPFKLGRSEAQEPVLCVDGNVQLAQGQAGLPFFEADGQPSAALLQVKDFLTQIENNRIATRAVCAQLRDAGLLQPWPIVLALTSGSRRIEGLQCLNEAALNALAPQALHALLSSGALAVAYCQLLAMQHVIKLQELADAHAELDAKLVSKPALSADGSELDLSFFSQNGTMTFSNL